MNRFFFCKYNASKESFEETLTVTFSPKRRWIFNTFLLPKIQKSLPADQVYFPMITRFKCHCAHYLKCYLVSVPLMCNSYQKKQTDLL